LSDDKGADYDDLARMIEDALRDRCCAECSVLREKLRCCEHEAGEHAAAVERMGNRVLEGREIISGLLQLVEAGRPAGAMVADFTGTYARAAACLRSTDVSGGVEQ
jgi:hypothetical protein